VRLLERDLNAELFVRGPRRLELTHAGHDLHATLNDAFSRITDVADRISSHGKALLTVGCGPVFGARWLRPRLARFRRAHADIEVNLETHSTMPAFGVDGVDVAIQFGDDDWPDLNADLLVATTSFPVCSPKLISRQRPLRTPSDLRRHTLLHDVPPDGWRIWLERAGVSDVRWWEGPRFRDMTLYVDAAVDGEGVALGDSLSCAAYLDSGKLVRPFDLSVDFGGFYLVAPPGSLDIPKVEVFRSWILAETAAERSKAA
jgi:LysR family glycine cleavage system transcriptional activator